MGTRNSVTGPIPSGPARKPVGGLEEEERLEEEEAKHEVEETKLKVEEEIKAREKADIGDVVKKIRDSVAVRAAEQYRQEWEQKNED